jgi:hypothetical protein
MRRGAGTIADDRHHPDVAATLDKWHGEAHAMLTLAISNDPGTPPTALLKAFGVQSSWAVKASLAQDLAGAILR